ncbi:MAG: TonB-dependent receptor plug domain-containing protein, partial [Longimicrobiales bacterium]
VALLLGGLAVVQGRVDASAQVGPDSTSAFPDTLLVEGVRVTIPRSLTDAGGVSAIEVRLDSMSVIPGATAEDFLRKMPLIQIRRNSRGEAQPALRGAEDRQIAVIVDGVPLTLGWDNRTDLSLIPLTAARSITLLRGLSSVLHGPNVLGGVIEVDVVKGSGGISEPPPMTFSTAVDDAGANTLSATGGALVKFDRAQWLIRAGLTRRDSPGVNLPDVQLSPARQSLLTDDGNLRLNTDVNHWDAFIATRYERDTGTWLSLTTSAYKAKRGVAPEFQESRPRLWRYPDQSRLLAAISGGTGQRNTGWGTGDIEVSVGIDVGSFEIQQFETPAFETVERIEKGDDRTLTLRVVGDHTVGAKGDLRAAFTYGDVSHDELFIPGEANSYRQRLWSLGTEVEWRFDNLFGLLGLGPTRVSAGVAVDGADTPESGDKPQLSRLWDWGGRLGASTAAYGGNLLFNGGFSRRVRFPALRELYSGALGRFLPNPTLSPEVLTGAELGVTWTFGRQQLQVVGFHQVLSDGIVRVSVETPGGRVRQRVNRDRIESSGIELLGAGSIGSISYAGDLTLQRVWQFENDPDTKIRPEYEPQLTGRMNVAVPFALKTTLDGEVRFVGDQYCLNNDSGDLDRLEDSRMFDFELRRLFKRSDRVFGNVDALIALTNVTDALAFDQCGLPQPGRTLRFQLRFF